MKKRCIFKKCVAILMLTVLVVFSFEACAKEPQEPAVITMTTKATKVSFTVAGKGEITIDWGDGKISNLNNAIESEMIPGWFVFAHEYSGTTAHSIVITGNVTTLYCRNNQLTALDVSRNTALTDLNCDWNQIKSLNVSKNTTLWALSCAGNQLTTSALNDLFKTLPDYSGSDIVGAIYISTRNDNSEIGNPGIFDCDRSIAEKKGWGFRTRRQ